jgi:cyclophilin family peptidyl-prolyl cis-trans isomerase
VSARLRLIGLKRPPAFADLWRWIELVQLVPGIGDNAVVAQLRAAASSYHPHLRYLARTALREVVGRPPREASWRADPRRPPAEPLTRPVTLRIETGAGAMALKLRPDWAPVTAAYFLALVDRGDFERTTIHRVVPGFVIQGGDATATGFGGDTTLMLSEWSAARYVRGVVGLAHAGKDTEGSQLFVTLGATPHLDGRYTAFGEIVAGLEVAERLIPGARIRIRRKGAEPKPAKKGRR